jgi:FkbM family methyltransferase
MSPEFIKIPLSKIKDYKVEDVEGNIVKLIIDKEMDDDKVEKFKVYLSNFAPFRLTTEYNVATKTIGDVEQIDSVDIVGMFGLDGEMDYHNIPYSSYVKSIVPSLDYNGKKDMHYILNEIFYQKVYNNDFVCVAENDIVFDIGFNYGFFTLDALTYKPKKVIGFEPNPKLVKLFNQLEIQSVELHKAAVSDKTGTTIFYENDFSGKSSIHSDVNSDTSANSYEVKICSFNDMAEQYDVIDYLKVDCEGAEYEIFESIPKEFLTNRIRKIALEFHHNINDIKVVNLISKIKECGFETKIDYKDGDSTGMLYARK